MPDEPTEAAALRGLLIDTQSQLSREANENKSRALIIDGLNAHVEELIAANVQNLADAGVAHDAEIAAKNEQILALEAKLRDAVAAPPVVVESIDAPAVAPVADAVTVPADVS